jgi:hypothetical protein
VLKAAGKGARILSAELHGNKLLIAGLAASGRGEGKRSDDHVEGDGSLDGSMSLVWDVLGLDYYCG